jgi:hypothetical protein
VIRAFHSFKQFTDIVDRKARPQVAEIPRFNDKTRGSLRIPAPGEARSQALVDEVFERPAGAARLGPEPGRNVCFYGQCRSHILMLTADHHDVYPANRESCRRPDRTVYSGQDLILQDRYR